MADETRSMGAEVGVRKIEDGEVTETRGTADRGTTRRGWAIFALLVFLSIFGVWQILELLALL